MILPNTVCANFDSDHFELISKYNELIDELYKFDTITYNHSLNVKKYVEQYWSRAGASQKDVSIYGICAGLHDIGKIDIPINLINGGKLSNEEFDIIKTHVNGLKYVEDMKSNKYYNKLRQAITLHHASYNDSRGYVAVGCKNLTGDSIPEHVRILTIADIYDALTAERSYKKSYSRENAFSTMVSEPRTDPKILLNFMICQYEHELIKDKETVSISAESITEKYMLRKNLDNKDFNDILNLMKKAKPEVRQHIEEILDL